MNGCGLQECYLLNSFEMMIEIQSEKKFEKWKMFRCSYILFFFTDLKS